MTKREEYEKKTEELILPILQEHAFELVDVEYVKEVGNWYLRAYIDKEGGITVDDCELVSRRMSDLLDEKDFIPESYIFEVSSPGLGRQLKKDKDFARSIGEAVEGKLFRAVDKRKDFEGVLRSFDKEAVVIETEGGQEMRLERDNIALIRLAIDF
ncbi:MAG: ribosome maturation factor RimP [Lachnospiraceae bacterium]|nr:ribosome maturation factor RimP [Lachnospiraceae bacterium]